MKKNKLKLNDVEVSSFITTNEKEAETVKGGAFDYLSLMPGLGGACMIYATAEAAVTTAEIIATVVRSQQQTDCAGATRAIAGCTNGTWPCDTNCL